MFYLLKIDKSILNIFNLIYFYNPNPKYLIPISPILLLKSNVKFQENVILNKLN